MFFCTLKSKRMFKFNKKALHKQPFVDVLQNGKKFRNIPWTISKIEIFLYYSYRLDTNSFTNKRTNDGGSFSEFSKIIFRMLMSN